MSSEIRKSVKFVQRIEEIYRHDWGNALNMGQMMDPPPDVIFFMSYGQDGIVGKDGEAIDCLKYMKDPASFAGRLKF